jgi:hypothetical protein
MQRRVAWVEHRSLRCNNVYVLHNLLIFSSFFLALSSFLFLSILIFNELFD